MRVAVLGSGSAGNALVVESRGRRLLVDVGFSCRQIEKRYESLGSGPLSLDAVLLTHEHSDHTKGVRVLAKRHQMPVYATRGTLDHLGRRLGEGDANPLDAHRIRSGEPFEIEAGGETVFRVEPFALPHDAREPVGFVIEDQDGHRMGLAADLGCRSQLAWGRLTDLDLLVLEANHDLQMLRAGPYPWHLKQRVASRHGHLSNREAAEGLAELVCDRLRTVVLYHLSQTNNQPALATETLGEALESTGAVADLVVSHQDRPTTWLDLPAATAG